MRAFLARSSTRALVRRSAADAGAKFGGIEGFGDVVDGAHVESADFVLGGIDAGEEDDGDVHGGVVGLEVGADGEAVAVGHVEIEEDEVGLDFAGGGETGGAAEGEVERDGLFSEADFDERMDVAGIVDDQDLIGHALVPLRVDSLRRSEPWRRGRRPGIGALRWGFPP